ncbi:hypothetical protein ACJRO7_023844 [Eucalyptus globulus]|uniref:25S rRNA (uridine-N(3))-methyltransferase BMT5-like domain-containing protein n=1 Tax=Eucalyptus globulus TaxID=34317 RepID=A0ABD3KA45_EUCGL
MEMHVKKKKRSIKHYSNLHKILLVGEGDFSFAVCLAQAFGSAVNIVATSVDSQAPNIEILEGLGGTILHEVDAHNMTEHPDLRHKSSDRIVFNFLHTGYKGHEHSNSQIQRQQEPVRAFLKSARSMLTRNGEIHQVEIEKLAEEDEKLRLVEKAKFSESDYSGYVNKRGDGS